MLKKLVLITGAAAMLASIGYSIMAFKMVMQSDAGTVLTFAASEELPLAPRMLATWRVQSWESCPATDRNPNPLGMTLRGYGLDGFDNKRVLRTAELLIELGCDVNKRSLVGHTAMHEAILYNEPMVIRFLLENGADPTVTIEIPNEEASTIRRYFSGMDSIRFAEELQQKSSQSEDRSKILQLLKAAQS